MFVRIINTNNQACKFNSNVCIIFFPFTITLLVREAGVKQTPNLCIIIFNHMIKKSFWNKLEKFDGPKRQGGGKKDLH